MIQTKTTHREIYVVALSEYGGAWLPSARYYTNLILAKSIVDERRATGEKCQLFTLFEYVEQGD